MPQHTIKKVPVPTYQVQVDEFAREANEFKQRTAALDTRRAEWRNRKRTAPAADGTGLQLDAIRKRCRLDERFLFASSCFVDPIVFDKLKALKERFGGGEDTDRVPEESVEEAPPNPLAERLARLRQRTAQESGDGNSPTAVARRRFAAKNISTRLSSSSSGAVGSLPSTWTWSSPVTKIAAETITSPEMTAPDSDLTERSESTAPPPMVPVAEEAPARASTLETPTNEPPLPEPTSSDAEPTLADESHLTVVPSNSRFDRQIREIHEMMARSGLATLREANQITLPSHLKPEMNYIISGASVTGTTPAALAQGLKSQDKDKRSRATVSGSSKSLAASDRPPGPSLAGTATVVATDEGNDAALAADDVILVVTLYNAGKQPTKMQELLVLGRQPLTVLRDSLFCMSDFLAHSGRIANPNTLAKKTSASYFFIEKTFYVDDRDPEAADYSVPIMRWASHPDRAYHPKFSGLQRRTMAETRFSDLNLRLHCPYRFVHQGDCEHTFVFTALRAPTRLDERAVRAYPVQTFSCFIHRYKCRMCRLLPAEYVTINDFHSGENPCFFCQNCYDLFHYDANGQPLYTYSAYPYMPAS
ncbi:hypothetical protein IWQ60_000405 [Tieghemiomyces parasiticus]|uniref:snRNA-activating protein complex subunit 3 n=1 Tax=Tieghemiomyces parasiticus TaxID=78921 RepID=A0A9W8AIW3_9FUNG|nr:hypothetical protein IWQ60_000405 [Tieghemiomyces parasiticus]